MGLAAGFSFVGITFADAIIARVRITLGTGALGANVEDVSAGAHGRPGSAGRLDLQRAPEGVERRRNLRASRAMMTLWLFQLSVALTSTTVRPPAVQTLVAVSVSWRCGW